MITCQDKYLSGSWKAGVAAKRVVVLPLPRLLLLWLLLHRSCYRNSLLLCGSRSIVAVIVTIAVLVLAAPMVEKIVVEAVDLL